MSATRLFVGNLPNDTNEVELRSAFSEYGKLVNLDLKTKPDVDQDKKVFAFVTLSASNYEVESCIRDFSNKEFHGNKLYVTRARESFLERLERERQEAQNKNNLQQKVHKPVPESTPKRKKLDSHQTSPIKDVKVRQNPVENIEKVHIESNKNTPIVAPKYTNGLAPIKEDKKKIDSDKKRLESLKRKRQEFKEKQSIIKSGLVGIDKVKNKKIKFDLDDEPQIDNNLNTGHEHQVTKKVQTLFDDDEDNSDGEVNFNVKEQFEGKKGQKVLDLQSRYKSDKRFVLDERFIEDENVEESEQTNNQSQEAEGVDPGTADEKSKQLSILQDVLGVAVTARTQDQSNKKTKTRMGMLRFDPLQPEHAKHLAPVDETKQEMKKSKKKKNKDKKVEEEPPAPPPIEDNKVEVSKEQFYKVSEKLKEVIAEPTTFSLRSLFNKGIEESANDIEQDGQYIPLESKEPKRKNPLEPGAKNPFMYDSSESEAEDEDKSKEDIQLLPQNATAKAVWKENFFFNESDARFIEALTFFTSNDNKEHKERRELKSLMKKRIYNKERKNQMFQKKIGGRKKSMKKSYNSFHRKK